MIGLGVDAIATLADTVVKRVWPDATETEKARYAQFAAELQAEAQAVAGQLEINKVEAGSPSLFVAGWRPFVGWVGAMGLAYAALIEPLARFIAVVWFHYSGAFPVLDSDITLQILFGLLGLGGLRSFEKARGVHRSAL